MPKLYLLTPNMPIKNHQFKGLVVIANNEQEAKLIHPYGNRYQFVDGRWSPDEEGYANWSWPSPDNVRATLLSYYAEPYPDPDNIVLISFNNQD